LRTEYFFRCISAFVAGVFLKLRTSHSPRVRHKPCRLYLGFHWRDFHYVIPRTFLLMRCIRCMFSYFQGTITETTTRYYVWSCIIPCCCYISVRAIFRRILHLFMAVALFCLYAFNRNLLNFQQNKFEDFYSAIQLNVFQL
jgi:hypothetical protein